MEQHYPLELFHETAESIRDFETQCSSDAQDTGRPFEDMAIESTKDGPSSSNDVVVGISNTAVSLDDSGPIRIQSESAKGGTVAALVRVLFGTSGRSRMVRWRDIALIPSFPATKQGGGSLGMRLELTHREISKLRVKLFRWEAWACDTCNFLVITAQIMPSKCLPSQSLQVNPRKVNYACHSAE